MHDSPAGGWRIKESAEGIFGTIVNGQVLYEEDKCTGALSGKVVRNSYHEQNRRSNASALFRATERARFCGPFRFHASGNSRPALPFDFF